MNPGKMHRIFLALSLLLGTKIYQVHSDDPHLKLEPLYRSVIRNLNETYSVKCYKDDIDNSIGWRNPLWKQIPKTNDNNKRIRVELNEGSVSYSKLIIENIHEEDAGIYTCGSRTSVSASFSLNVLNPITFDDSDAHQFAVLGYPYTVKCTVRQQGNRNLTVWWRRQTISRDENYLGVDFSRMVRLRQGLLINKVNKNDSQVDYICRAIDLKAERPYLKEQRIRLTVLKKNFTLSEAYGSIGETSHLKCNADPHLSTNSPITFTWYDKSSKQIYDSQQTGMCISNNPRFSILQVPIKDDNSFGTFTCTMNDGNRMFAHKFNLSELHTLPVHAGVNNLNTPTVNPADIMICEPPLEDYTTKPPPSDPHALDSVEMFPPKNFSCELDLTRVFQGQITIAINEVCDGVPDCPNRDDEDVILCQGLANNRTTSHLPPLVSESLLDGLHRNETVITYKTVQQKNATITTYVKKILLKNDDGTITTTTTTNTQTEEVSVVTSHMSDTDNDNNLS